MTRHDIQLFCYIIKHELLAWGAITINKIYISDYKLEKELQRVYNSGLLVGRSCQPNGTEYKQKRNLNSHDLHRFRSVAMHNRCNRCANFINNRIERVKPLFLFI